MNSTILSLNLRSTYLYSRLRKILCIAFSFLLKSFFLKLIIGIQEIIYLLKSIIKLYFFFFSENKSTFFKFIIIKFFIRFLTKQIRKQPPVFKDSERMSRVILVLLSVLYIYIHISLIALHAIVGQESDDILKLSKVDTHHIYTRRLR